MGGLYNGADAGAASPGIGRSLRRYPRAGLLPQRGLYPLVPEEVTGFCAGKRAILSSRRAIPITSRARSNVMLRRADLNTKVMGKGCLPMAGEYTADASGRASLRSYPRRGPRASMPMR